MLIDLNLKLWFFILFKEGVRKQIETVLPDLKSSLRKSFSSSLVWEMKELSSFA